MLRSKRQILKTASTLKEFSNKIKSAQDEVLTPEAVKDMAEEIREIVEVAVELADEISEGVPAEEEEPRDALGEREPRQIEVAADETDDEKKKRMDKEKTAADDEDDDDNEKIKNLEAKLANMERETKLAKLAPKYASLFPKTMHESKLNEILNSKQSLQIVEAKIKEATEIITNKTMIKVASMSDSIFSIGDSSDGEEVNIAAKM